VATIGRGPLTGNALSWICSRVEAEKKQL
jgi:hypothetical protein